MQWVLGVDGCRDGTWIGALAACDGRVRWRLLADAGEILHGIAEADAVGVDIPIGLPATGFRECDRAARGLLGPRRSTVFLTPPGAVLAAESYEQACALARQSTGRAVSREIWGLRHRIADVNAAITPRQQPRVVECHPELSFAQANSGAPLPSKHTAAGIGERLRVSGAWVPDPAEVLSRTPRPARADDALDALAAAWSARRWLRGEALVLPYAEAPRDERGLRMQIIA